MNYVKLALSSVAGIAFAASASARQLVSVPLGGCGIADHATISKAVSEHAPGLRCANRLWVERNSISRCECGELEFGISTLQYDMAAMARVCRRNHTKT